MTTDDAKRWKEKYLKSIEQHEKLERNWQARLDLLRRGLVRSTLAAEGTDRTVDQCMKEMREAVRNDEMDAALAALIPRLEKAVLDSEQRRETRIEQISTALNALVTQLQALPLPREVSKPLKSFAKQLDSRVAQAREIPLLLGELSHFQGQALAPQLAGAEAPKPSLLQRLFGSSEVEKPATEPASAPEPDALTHQAQPHETPAQAVAIEPLNDDQRLIEPASTAAPSAPSLIEDDIQSLSPVEMSPLAEPAQDVEEDEHAASGALESVVAIAEAQMILDKDADPLDSLEIDAVYALPDAPEPTYSSVAAHIEATLLGLLNDLSLPEHHRPHAEAMRSRLEKGLNWYELLPILDDLAVLMLAVSDSGQHEFETYLKQLNERLESFQGNLQAVRAGHAEGQNAADDLHTQLREHVGELQSSVQDATDLNSLKHILETRLEGLLGTINQHQHERDAREQEVSAHLQGLAERVAHMEQQAQGYREHLEEQRQKALIDPLTGLPNRAAWCEQLAHEVEQWQLHGNMLLVAMLDLDHFKRINDSYGHLAGDKVLKIIASQLRKNLRPTDFIARFGGEEFVLLMPDTPMSTGLQLAEKMRAAVEACPFHFKGEPVTVTLSMGFAAFKPGDRSDQVLKRADQALYRAKDAGRNTLQQG